MADAHISLLDAIHDHSSLVTRCGYSLGALAEAAATLGMDRMANRLGEISDDLRASAKAVTAAHANSIAARLHESEQATANMMNAVFAAAVVS